MARIAGVDIPKDKKVAYSLRYVHGIGLKTAIDICDMAKVDPNVRVTDLSSKDEDAIRKVIVDMKQQTNCCCTTEPSRLINLISV